MRITNSTQAFKGWYKITLPQTPTAQAVVNESLDFIDDSDNYRIGSNTRNVYFYIEPKKEILYEYLMQGFKRINNLHAQNSAELMHIKKLNLKNYEDNFELMDTSSIADIYNRARENAIKEAKRKAFDQRFEKLTEIKKKHHLT